MSNIELVKKIREATGLPFKDIQKAIAEIGEDRDAVIDHLRKQGALKAQARGDRETGEGFIFSYIHGGKIGAMIEIRCETDFVARSEDFQTLGKNLCIHAVSFSPKFLSENNFDEAFVEKELEIARAQLANEGKTGDIVEKILEGKKAKVIKEFAFMSQPWIMDNGISVQDAINAVIQKTGENIQVTKFVVFHT